LQDTALSSLECGLIIVAYAVFVLEDLGFDDVVKVLMRLLLETGLDKVVLLELELAFSSESTFIKLLVNVVIFRVSLDIGFEVVAVLLLFFGEAPKEVSVVLSPSLALALEHPLLSALVVIGIGELSCSEFLHLVECSVKFSNSLFDVPPGLIQIFAIWSWEVNSVLS
jgi:hypothetical protein